MNKSIRTLFIAISIFLTINTLSGQEHLTGLSDNRQLGAQPLNALKNGTKVILPLREDFSGFGIYPNNNIWADRYAFVNNDYPLFPVSRGVATLDAINDTGAIYNDGGSFTFIADYLTSNAIRLDSIFGSTPRGIRVSDSLYLSFFYQPQGIGNRPNDDDSLVLEFFVPGSNTWHHIWSSAGMSYNEFTSGGKPSFRQVIVPITDSLKYFNSEFRFRFFNYASLSNNSIPSWGGNVDQWHLDYIYLNINRSLFDTVYNDVCFVNSARSVLDGYTAIPWKQFNAAPSSLMLDSFYHTISNIDNITYNTTYQYKVTDETGNQAGSYTGGNINLSPFALSGYQNYQPHAVPPVNFNFPTLTGDTAFHITHILEMVGSTDDIRINDTIRYTQRFYNYFAYDDGTAEAGYGLSLNNGRVACQFEAFQPDSLQAVQMFFNRTLNDANVKFFYLTVWDDNQGKPGNVIYEESYQLPKHKGDLNGFVTYDLDQAVLVSGKFYVGWRQTTSDNLNLGFDLNNDSHTRNFYNTSGSWDNSLFAGSLMIRPILGLSKEVHVAIEEPELTRSVRIFPNPAVQNVQVEIDGLENMEGTEIILYDASGRKIMQIKGQNHIELPELPAGLYFLSILDGRNVLAREKLIIAR
jgi:hypothetical protein